MWSDNKLHLSSFTVDFNPLKVHIRYEYHSQNITIVCEGIIELINVLTKLEKKCKLHSIKADILTDKEKGQLQGIIDIARGAMYDN